MHQIKNLIHRMLLPITFILIFVWILMSLLLYLFQPKFVYFPQSTIAYTPDMVGLPYEDIHLLTKDNINIHGWFIPVKEASKTLLFFHGNGGNISHRLESLKIFHDMGLSVFIIDYRGYGQSEGKPSEQGTYQDAEAAWKYLTKTRGIADKDIITFGRSMGGAVATWLASQHAPDLLILESTFTSIADMGKHYYPYLPTQLLIRIKYASIDRIGDIQCPVLIAHSQSDEIVPYALGQRLFEKVKSTRVFMELQGGHNDGFIVNDHSYTEGIMHFINAHTQNRKINNYDIP